MTNPQVLVDLDDAVGTQIVTINAANKMNVAG